jgi:L-asparaginase
MLTVRDAPPSSPTNSQQTEGSPRPFKKRKLSSAEDFSDLPISPPLHQALRASPHAEALRQRQNQDLCQTVTTGRIDDAEASAKPADSAEAPLPSQASSPSPQDGLQVLLSAISTMPPPTATEGNHILKSLLFLYPGGTIGCVGNPLAPMPGEDFEAAFRHIILPIVRAQYSGLEKVDFHSFEPPIDSTNAQPENWCAMAKVVLNNYNKYDGFVVLHGTDTMAWTGSALSYLLPGLSQEGKPLMPLTKPVVVTGSQLPLFKKGEDGQLVLKFGTDAMENVCGAIQSCAQMLAGLMPKQVCLSFARQTILANCATKIETDGFGAFGSPNRPLLAKSSIQSFNDSAMSSAPVSASSDETLKLVLDQVQAVEAVMATGKFSVAVFTAVPQKPKVLARLVQGFLNDPDIHACIFEGFGAGNFPAEKELTPLFKKAHKEGKTKVAATQVVGGTVAMNTYAAGSWLDECGFISAADMTTPAAHAKLTVLLALNQVFGGAWGQKGIEALFQRSLAGEMSVSKLINQIDTQ